MLKIHRCVLAGTQGINHNCYHYYYYQLSNYNVVTKETWLKHFSFDLHKISIIYGQLTLDNYNVVTKDTWLKHFSLIYTEYPSFIDNWHDHKITQDIQQQLMVHLFIERRIAKWKSLKINNYLVKTAIVKVCLCTLKCVVLLLATKETLFQTILILVHWKCQTSVVHSWE